MHRTACLLRKVALTLQSIHTRPRLIFAVALSLHGSPDFGCEARLRLEVHALCSTGRQLAWHCKSAVAEAGVADEHVPYSCAGSNNPVVCLTASHQHTTLRLPSIVIGLLRASEHLPDTCTCHGTVRCTSRPEVLARPSDPAKPNMQDCEDNKAQCQLHSSLS